MIISNTGFDISEDHPFLGASPDGYAYNFNAESYGLVQVKCAYKYRGYAPAEACHNADLFCKLVTQCNGDQPFQLK